MTGKEGLVLWIVVAAMLFVLAVSPAAATVTIEGKVEYWDRIANAYKPAANALVEVEGDWWDFWNDPQVTTDANGQYVAHYRDPYWSWDDFDISVDVYARTPSLIEIYEDMLEAALEMYPYHATSHTVEGIKGGGTCTIDVKIGGPASNLESVWTRTPDETANAFVVHHEVLLQARELMQRGFLPPDFDEVEVIVPAAGVAPYYNHFTGFVNLWVSSAGNLGVGDWTNLPTGNSSYVAYPSFEMTVRHEYSHAIHDLITGVFPPLGLNMPADHSPQGETNRWLAYTEGWAEFLPLACIGIGGQFEPSRSTPMGGQGLGLPAAEPPGGHYAYEGEVSALLWDLHDPSGQPEVLRHPVTQATDGRPVPADLIDQQTWTDRIGDHNLAAIKAAVEAWTMLPPWPVDTIEEFLGIYKFLNQQNLHAIKAIAFNRDITNSMPPEHPATISTEVSVKRSAGTVTLGFTVTEPDPEDRSFVDASLWRQVAGGTASKLGSVALSGNWNGSDLAVTPQFQVPVPTAAQPDLLWLVVSDEMLPTAYCLENPAAEVFIVKLPRDRPDWSKIGPLQPAAGIVTADVKPLDDGKPIRDVSKAVSRLSGGKEDDAAKAGETLRGLVEEAEVLLAGYAGRQEAARRHERRLVGAARTIGELPVSKEAVRRPALARGTERATRDEPLIAEPQMAAAYHDWLTQTAAGARPKRAVPDDARASLTVQDQALGKAAAAQAEAAARAAGLAKELRAAAAALQLPPEMALVQEDSQRTAERLATALEGLSTDKELEPRLAQAQRVVRTLAATGPETAPPVTPGPPTAADALLSADFEAAAPQGWVMSPGAAIAKTDQGGVLACSDMGHGLWFAQFPADFTMKLRYKHGTGLGHIAFRGTGELPKDSDYRLRLDGATVTLARAEGGQEAVLASRGLQLQPGTWHALGIQIVGGKIAVAADEARVLEASDPNPLPNGIMGFGCINGKDFAYDDIRVLDSKVELTATPAAPGPVEGPEPLGESFDTPAPPGWVLVPGATIAQQDGGGMLLCSEMGHGLWVAAFPEDFLLAFRYRHGGGIGQALFRGTGQLPQDNDYRLRFDGATATLARADLGKETILASVPLVLQPGNWYGFRVLYGGGRIQLVAQGEVVLDFVDPEPLPNGLVAFGCVNGKDIAFDEIRIVPR